MVMPGGISPEQALAALETGEHVSMRIIKYPDESRIDIQFIKINPRDDFDTNLIADLIANKLREMLNQYFHIKGEVITRRRG